MFESLESRRFFAAGAQIVGRELIIEGTAGDDEIIVDRDVQLGPPVQIVITVTVNSVDFDFLEDDYDSAVINALDGDDVINAHYIFKEHRINAGAGNDDVLGGRGAAVVGGSFIRGGPGRDTLVGSSRNDTIHGDNGNDYITGGNGGGRGNDLLYGGNGNDQLYGGLHNDTLRGGNGNDVLRGQQDNDRLVPGAGADRVRGGSGNDRIFADGAEGGGIFDDLNGGDGDDDARADGNDVLTQIEQMIV